MYTSEASQKSTVVHKNMALTDFREYFRLRAKNTSLLRKVVSMSILIGSVLFYQSITKVPAGHVGVVDFYGHVQLEALEQGVRFVFPFSKVIPMTLRAQTFRTTANFQTSENPSWKQEVSILFRLKPTSVVKVYIDIGADYVEKIVIPIIQQTLTSKILYLGYTKDDEYAVKSQKEVGEKIIERLTYFLDRRGIVMISFWLRDIEEE